MIRVLVADEKVCQLICKLIHWEELEMKLVGTASNGIGSLQMIEAEHPDLVMTGYPDGPDRWHGAFETGAHQTRIWNLLLSVDIPILNMRRPLSAMESAIIY